MNDGRHTPVVSVCIPTYEYGRFIEQAIESVLGQTFTDFELIVVDDCSSDDTAERVARFHVDPRFTFRRNDENVGMFANFNLTASLARGPLLKFLCADDWLDPSFLERAVAMLSARSEATLLTCGNWMVDANGRVIGRQSPPFGPSGRVTAARATELMARHLNVIGMPSNTLVRRDAFERVGGFDAVFAPAADVHLWLKLLQQGDLCWIDEPLAFARYQHERTHVYGGDPTEAPFRCWLDAAGWSPTTVSATTLRTALAAEAERNLLHALADALRLRPGKALRIVRYTRRYTSLPRAFGMFALRSPWVAFEQARRLAAIALRRQVVYDPRPHIGPPLDGDERQTDS